MSEELGAREKFRKYYVDRCPLCRGLRFDYGNGIECQGCKIEQMKKDAEKERGQSKLDGYYAQKREEKGKRKKPINTNKEDFKLKVPYKDD